MAPVTESSDPARVGRCCVGRCPAEPHTKSCGCPCDPAGCKHAASWTVQDRVTAAQRQLRPRPVVPRSRRDYRAIARWWELEAEREDESSESSRQYARNYRWLVELMDAGRRVTADAHGVYIDGELASAVQRRGEREAAKQVAAAEKRAALAVAEAARPSIPRRRRRA